LHGLKKTFIFHMEKHKANNFLGDFIPEPYDNGLQARSPGEGQATLTYHLWKPLVTETH
jgi:hypothetical protein